MPQYDHAERRRAVRKGREKGCWVYIPQEELQHCGEPFANGEPPFYRTWGAPGRGRVMVSLYTEK
jgi:hypothetical protein